MAAPRVLLLLSRRSYRADDFLDAAARLGAEVTVGTDHRATLARFAPEATLYLDLADAAASLPAIVALHRQHPLRAIVAAEDEGAVLAAEASAALDLPHNAPVAVRAARRKDLMRAALQRAELPSPRHRVWDRSADAASAAAEARAGVGYPCVLKPVALSAGRGVIRADDEAAFVAAWRRIERILQEPDARRTDPAAARLILAESYMRGPELALEGLLERGRLRLLALFDKPDPLDGPFFEETLYITPSRLPRAAASAVVEVVARACAALGLRDGPVHAELRWSGDAAWLLEIAPRSIGGLCSRVLRFGVGVSLEELILRHAIGMEPLIPHGGTAGARAGPVPDAVPDVHEAGRGPAPRQEAAGAAGVLMLPVPGAGVLRAIEGVDAARAVEGVEGVTILARRGDELVPLPEGHRYPGFVFARGATPAAVESALRRAGERIRLVVG